jgi:penicillin-binding protein 1C
VIKKIALSISLFTVAGIVFIASDHPVLPSFERVRADFKPSDILVLDQGGRALQQVRGTDKYRSLPWVELQQVSKALVPAILKSEDKNFLAHGGVDYRALLASAWQSFKGHKRGASTLSMQTVKLISPDKKVWAGATGKLRQLHAAYALESEWSKEQILEAYLNLVPLKGELIGLSAASFALFDKPAQGLNLLEATVLAVLIRSPNAHEKMVLQRSCQQESEFCEQLSSVVAKSLKRSAIRLAAESAYHLSKRIMSGSFKESIQTTIDGDLQKYAQERLQAQVALLKNQNVHDGAIFVIENKTGEVKAYVGSSGPYSTAPFVDGITALRQAGSTLKPFLYATAFERKILTPKSWLEDSPIDIVFDRGVYKPQNHDRSFYGWVRAETALASSLNVPAVKVFKLLNDESFWGKMNEMQFRELKEPEHYGPALALGVADVSLEDLTLAYHALAEGGFYSRAHFTKNEKELMKTQVFTAEAANTVAQVLRQKELRSLGFGMDSALSAIDGASVKTGTSKDMRDNWCVGFNSKYTVGVWIGNFSGEPMWNVMGVTGAAPLWVEVMQWLQKKDPEVITNQLAEVTEGDESPTRYPQAKILYPQNGMVLAIDPDIPVKNQKVPFMAEIPPGQKVEWRLNKNKISGNANNYLWQPKKGKHHLELLQNGIAKESIEIYVK